MGKYYLAIDIGASSGRHILAKIEDGKIMTEEIYRFENAMEHIDGSLCWNLEKLFGEIVNGLKKCKEKGKLPSYMGIDTWGVDYVLLDKNNQVLGKAYAYRDKRTEGMDKKVYSVISEQELYQRTGIQKQIFNTIYQLTAAREMHPEEMEQAERLLMIPDYFHYLLTGIMRTEYTNATTTQLVNAETGTWDSELIHILGFNTNIFGPMLTAGATLGPIQKNIEKEIGFACTVVLPATHDTASAVLAAPICNDDGVYISSGTWSLMGIEREKPDCSLESMHENFTNEGGYDHRFRYLKNIMGLWMIQSVKKELKEAYSYATLCSEASKANISSVVDCNDACFFAPESMLDEIKKYCKNTNQTIPESPGEVAAVIYNSLAKCYDDTVKKIEHITQKSFKKIYVVGGGANAGYLNERIAEYTGKEVCIGPVEATAIGNLVVQMMGRGEMNNLTEARTCIEKSFVIKKYEVVK